MAEHERETVIVVEPVKVVDIRMPFWSMVVFMIKWAIASIPALFILWMIFYLSLAFFSGFLQGLQGLDSVIPPP